MLSSKGLLRCRPDEQLASVMQTNAVGPMFMYKHFEHLLSQGQKKTLINTSSNFGSITLASQPLDDKKKRTPLDHTQIVYKVLVYTSSCTYAFTFAHTRLKFQFAHPRLKFHVVKSAVQLCSLKVTIIPPLFVVKLNTTLMRRRQRQQ